MCDRQRSIQLTSEEIDQLLADSSISLHSSDDNVVTRTPLIASEHAFTREDLALLDETNTSEHPSPTATEEERGGNVVQAAPVLSSQTERIPTVTAETLADQFESGPTISVPPTVKIIQVTQRKEETVFPNVWLVRSRLTCGRHLSSKLITGVVSSLLSPWVIASRQSSKAPEHSLEDVRLVQERHCEDSLINAFEKIGVADNYSEHDDVFFSPNREREEAKSAKNASMSPAAIVLRSAMMEDTRCDLNTESSVYSDAISAQSSSLSSFPEVTRHTILPFSQRSPTNRFNNSNPVPSPYSKLLSEVESFPSGKPDYCGPSVSPNNTVAEVNTLMPTKNASPDVDISESEVFHRNIPSAASEISGGTSHLPSHEVFENFTGVHPESHEQPNINSTLQSISESGVPCPIRSMMVSLFNTNEEWNKMQNPTDSPSVRISLRKLKPTIDKRKAEAKDECISRAVGALNAGLQPDVTTLRQRSSKQYETLTIEQPSPQLSSSARPSALGSVNGELASPMVLTTVARRRATHRIPVLDVATRPVPAPRHSAPKITTQPALQIDREIAEEKAQLRREIKALRAKEDILRLILNKYEVAFEKALDQRSQVHFAAGTARAQANNDVSETRRQAATLYNAVLDSQRRHERMHETIQKAEANQEEWLKRVESLRTKHARQSEKGVTYQKYCLGKIQRALENQETVRTEMEKELSKLRVHFKQMELKQRSLETELRQKAQENRELTRICDSLLT
ncbi:unnamed protein product [Hydatigera taeniaeformis]|uniref:TACC_C domain-containing protein n=1 Tax=Hydatigena taeniaeformis TaxID=6205 RepID=A0A0R3X033_HYDTA|nr:unnamed protein product [Hydatigera taeniaeformis]